MNNTIYQLNGTKSTTKVDLPVSIFGITEINHNLIRDAYQSYLANGRSNNAVTKTRGLVSGGGKKPWRQKGTGRARFGSSRNPIWRGGGIAFGPTGLENYSRKINLKAKRIAVKQALSIKASEDAIVFIKDSELKSAKTKIVADIIKKLVGSGSVLLVVKSKTDNLLLATANLSDVKLVSYNYLNVCDILNADHLIIDVNTISDIEKWLNSGVK